MSPWVVVPVCNKVIPWGALRQHQSKREPTDASAKICSFFLFSVFIFFGGLEENPIPKKERKKKHIDNQL
jgi:hypothetical protein